MQTRPRHAELRQHYGRRRPLAGPAGHTLRPAPTTARRRPAARQATTPGAQWDRDLAAREPPPFLCEIDVLLTFDH